MGIAHTREHARMLIARSEPTNACHPYTAVQAERKPTAAQQQQGTRHCSATPTTTSTANPQILAKQEEDAAAAAAAAGADMIDLMI